MAREVGKIKRLAKGVVAKKRALSLAVRGGIKKGAEMAGKGTVLALAAGGVAGTGGTVLAERGKLSVNIGNYRYPIIGTLIGILTGFAAWMTRKKPRAWKPLAAVSVSAFTSQILDIAKHGIKVKPEVKGEKTESNQKT